MTAVNDGDLASEDGSGEEPGVAVRRSVGGGHVVILAPRRQPDPPPGPAARRGAGSPRGEAVVARPASVASGSSARPASVASGLSAPHRAPPRRRAGTAAAPSEPLRPPALTRRSGQPASFLAGPAPGSPGASLRSRSRPGRQPPPPWVRPRARHGRRHPAGRRQLARSRLALVVGVTVMVVLVAVGMSNVAAGPPTLSVAVSGAHGQTVDGVTPALPWPAAGGAAVSVPAAGMLVVSGPQQPVPVASLTKIMTAYLVLQDHPLAPSAQGPFVTMTAADVADTATDERNGDTSVPVTVGERLSERQLLDGLIVHSANNFADTLARWDAGSIGAFVAKMNATAAAFGMTHTHYVDTNGIHAGSVSTAADQLRLTARAMTIPTFAAVADQSMVDLPLAGPLANYVSAVGQDGVVGVKSGFTQAAMGCLVLAAYRQVAGRNVLVLAAVTGQPGYNPLGSAQSEDLALVNAVAAHLQQRVVVTGGTTEAAVHVPWASGGDLVRAATGATMLVWPGSAVRTTVAVDRLQAPVAAGERVGSLTVSDGGERVVVPLVVRRSVPSPGLLWRLLH